MSTEEPAPGPEPIVDARGTRCPEPVIRVARASRELPRGSVVVLLADDVAARADVPAWARLKGHTVSLRDDDGWTAYRVVLGGAARADPHDERST
ncbi:MAG: sulfurtransferase TusA family protein [Ornithinibacter sp.]